MGNIKSIFKLEIDNKFKFIEIRIENAYPYIRHPI